MENQQFRCEADRIAELRNALTGALIGLARATDGNSLYTENTWPLMIESLRLTSPDTVSGESELQTFLGRIREEKRSLAPMCAGCASPCGKNNDYDLSRIADADAQIRSLKFLILSKLRDIASRIHPVTMPDSSLREMGFLLCKALFSIGEDWEAEDFLSVAVELDAGISDLHGLQA